MTAGVRYSSPTALYVGERIRERRLGLGLHQRDLARRMQIHASIPALWEVNKRPVPHARLEALAAALETTAEMLLSKKPFPRRTAPRPKLRRRAHVRITIPSEPKPPRIKVPTANRDSHARRFTAAVNEYPTRNPLALLAISVIGCAVDDCKHGPVAIDPIWLELGDIDVRLVLELGIKVIESGSPARGRVA
jgi:transcriptional regulator with XRE-family HTH domain